MDTKTYQKEYQKRYRQTEKYKIGRKRYQQSEKGKAILARYRQSEKYKVLKKFYRQSERNIALRRIARKSCDKKYKTEHPKQIKAIGIVNSAVIAGKLPRADTLQCHDCPAQAQHYHHYKGYEPKHWFEVVPLCRKCHREIHKKSA